MTKEQLERLITHYKTDTAIGKALGVSSEAIRVYRKKWGLKTSTELRIERDAAIIKESNAGNSPDALADMFGMTKSGIKKILLKGRDVF